jgi:hypothetical protein
MTVLQMVVQARPSSATTSEGTIGSISPVRGALTPCEATFACTLNGPSEIIE